MKKHLKSVYCADLGPIVYQLGHILLKDGSWVRFPVGSHIINMNLHIIAIGKKKSEYDEMIREYQKRIVAPFGLSIDVNQSETVVGKIKDNDYVIALDEKGKDFTTAAFAQTIEKLLHTSHKRIVFIIGGAYGLEQAVRDRANMTMCLGKLTLPHEMARLVLTEQLYRVTNLIGGGKYHH